VEDPKEVKVKAVWFNAPPVVEWSLQTKQRNNVSCAVHRGSVKIRSKADRKSKY